MNILIVGGAGYIGTELTKSLFEKGYHVTVIDRNIFLNHSFKCHRFIQKDIRDVSVSDFKDIEIVLDYSGISNDPTSELDESLTYSINVDGRLKCAESAKAAGVKKYVFASSCSVYGSVDIEEPVTEESVLNPLTPYARSAMLMEEKLKSLSTDDFRVLCIRHGTVYGFSGKMRLDLVVNLMCKSALLGKSIFVTGGGEQNRPLISIKNISCFISTIISYEDNFNLGKTYDIVNLSEGNVKMITLANTLVKNLSHYLNEKIELTIVPDDADKRDYSVNTEKLNSLYNFCPDFMAEDTIKSLIDGLKEIDMGDPRFVTQRWYNYILKIEKSLTDIGSVSR